MSVKELSGIPCSEREVPAEVAEPWFQVSPENKQLEGLCFDRAGDLHLVDVFEGNVYKLEMTGRKLTVLATLTGENPAALKIHRDGRLFVCCLANMRDNGSIVAMAPDGSELETIVGPELGYVPDDMVFDSDGGFYFSDFTGPVFDPTGGIYHVSGDALGAGPVDGSQITAVVPNLATPNGLALSPDEHRLWVTEMAANRLHFIQLGDDRVSIPPYGTSVPYTFSGLEGPDSCSIDADGNLYVAMYEQGRVLCFTPEGVLAKQILLPDREQGRNRRSTHPMIIPGTSTLLICTNDFGHDGGSWIFAAEALGKGYDSYQFS
ncbi:SMP-30/gluconolactonase/LRE family protein [Acidipropionibacterium jensenii]|uniref:SMP-30/gluconolactonase/LRE family protein n=2 Tax=Acidipropionibacterium jensenii TaxID=1749 RepID=UPI00110A3B99|nr:SMP-30/gluconolactonase/LRE family protein [Acidipropionibacterium jensenii]QCV87640.1 SMP-30/gluconolactonase/LRE family protein [Acidipropionibacterium jensenii]